MKLMQISAFTDAEFKTLVLGDNHIALRPYRFMLNPDAIKLQHTFNSAQSSDNSAGNKLSFETVIDATGLIDPKRINLPAEIKRLEGILYAFHDQAHQPNFVKIEWGDHLVFYGKLTSMDVNYTLFKPDGTPLRVKLALVFDQCFPPLTH